MDGHWYGESGRGYFTALGKPWANACRRRQDWAGYAGLQKSPIVSRMPIATTTIRNKLLVDGLEHDGPASRRTTRRPR